MDRSRRPPDPPQQSSSEQRSPKPSRRGCSERVGDVEVERAAVRRGDSGPRHACPYRRGVPCGDHRRRPPAPADCVMLNQGLMSSLRSPRSTTSSREWRPMRARRRVSCAGRPRRRPAAGAPGEPRLARRHRRGRDGRRRLHDRAPRRQLARRLRALQLAARGRARSVVAFARPGGWPEGVECATEVLRSFPTMQEQLRPFAPRAEAFVATAEGRRMATGRIVTHSEHYRARAHRPPAARRRRLQWPRAAARARIARWLPRRRRTREVPGPRRLGHRRRAAVLARGRHALPRAVTPPRRLGRARRVRHSPQLDVPLEAAQLVLGFTGAA